MVFLATGQYMRLQFPAAYAGDATMRMLFRSAHIYLLLSSIMNLLVGVHAAAPPSRVRQVGSVLLLAAPVLFFLAFAVEPEPGLLDRPYVLFGAIASLVGAGLHAISGMRRRAPASSAERV
jgi:hypothetical protein